MVEGSLCRNYGDDIGGRKFGDTDEETEEKTYLEFARFSMLPTVPSLLLGSILVIVDNELFNVSIIEETGGHSISPSFVKDSYGGTYNEMIKIPSMVEESLEIERNKIMAKIAQMMAEKQQFKKKMMMCSKTLQIQMSLTVQDRSSSSDSMGYKDIELTGGFKHIQAEWEPIIGDELDEGEEQFACCKMKKKILGDITEPNFLKPQGFENIHSRKSSRKAKRTVKGNYSNTEECSGESVND
ncbi:hypothetical protein Ancab_021389 [Ancistrocladus abbreviatus]